MESSREKKIRELQSTLRQLQAMELHEEEDVIETPYPYNLPVVSPGMHNYGVPGLPYEYYNPVPRNPVKRFFSSTYFIIILLSVTLSSSFIGFILYKDAWFDKTSMSNISLFKTSNSSSSKSEHQQLTDSLIENIQAKSRKQLHLANRLISQGKILEARKLLLRLTKTEAKFSNTIYAKVSIALARTYDVGVLKTIPHSNAQPEATEAEYWYRQWYKASAGTTATTRTGNN